ncbi:MAG: hypothetical protein ACTHQQ_07470 [Solirubrobacteraceae bacterium]
MLCQGRRLFGRLTISIAVAVGIALALSVADARAALLNLTTCNTSELTQPFAPWADPASYELAPGGDFENAAWTLSGGAQRVPGSEPFAATGKRGNWSLRLPAGSSAQSPTTCVDAAYPSVRFFIAGKGSVAVSLIAGNTVLPAGIAFAGFGWFPAPVMVTSSAVVAALSNGVAQVSLRFTVLSGDLHVDDVFVDPWNRGR